MIIHDATKDGGLPCSNSRSPRSSLYSLYLLHLSSTSWALASWERKSSHVTWGQAKNLTRSASRARSSFDLPSDGRIADWKHKASVIFSNSICCLC